MITYSDLYEQFKNCKTEIISEIDEDGNIKSYQYLEVLAEAERLCEKFQNLKLSSRDTFIICASGGFKYTAVFLAIFKLNATAVLLDKDISRAEFQHLSKQIKAGIILTDTEHIPQFENKANILIDLQTDKTTINDSIKKPEQNNTEGKCVIFSSGTTSRKSGIVHKTSNIYEMIRYTRYRYKTQHGQSFLTIVPNSHIYGLSINIIYSTYIGTKIYYLKTLDAKILFKTLEGMEFDYFCGVTKMFEFFESAIESKMRGKAWIVRICFWIRRLTHLNIGKFLFRKVFDTFGDMCLITAGSPLNDHTEKFLFSVGFPIIEFYGATETGVPTICTANQNHYTPGIGKPLHPCKVKQDPTTKELLISNDFCMQGYLEDSEEHASIMDQNGWIRTGDICKISHHNVYIVGRIKEVIILSNGEKISPDDMEFYYKNIKGVVDFAICGAPKHPKSKCDEPHMFVMRDPKVTEEEIQKSIRSIASTLDATMRIKNIHFVNEIPRTSIGKPKRYLLRQSLKNIA